MKTEKDLTFAANKALTEARKIDERATAEKRDMSAEEKASFDQLMAECQKNTDDIAELMSQRDDEPADEKHDDEPPADDKDERANRFAKMEAQLRQSTGRVSRPALGLDGADYRSSKKYLAAYRNWLQHGIESRDLSLGDGTGAGYLVTPVKLADDIITAINNLVFVRQMANITKLTEARSLGNPQLTADVQAITWGDEVTVSSADSTMAFGRRDLTPIMATNLVKVSYRELQAASRVEELVAQRIALSFAYGEEAAYLTGDGSGHPLGVFTASASGVPTSRDVTATGSSHSIAADDLFNMVYSIPQQYQNSKNFVWVLHRDAVKMLVKLKDSNGQYLWSVGGVTNGLQTSRIGTTLCGIPVCQSEYAPNTFSANAYIAVLGDFS